MKTYQGSCHCGTTKFEVDADIDNVRVCDCSICRKRGAVIFRVDKDSLRMHTPMEALNTYQWHTKTATDYFCPNCGILPFRHPRTAPEMWAINVRCIEEIDIASIPRDEVHGSNLS